MRFAIITLFALTLSACHSFDEPGFMPTGYTYHGNEFNAPPGPKAANIGYPYSADHNEAVLQRWEWITTDMVDRMQKKLGLTPQPLYLEAPDEHSALHQSLDHKFREALERAGFALKPVPEEATLYLRYNAQNIDEISVWQTRSYQQEQGAIVDPGAQGQFKDFIFSVQVMRDGREAAEITEFFRARDYGYERDKEPESFTQRMERVISEGMGGSESGFSWELP